MTSYVHCWKDVGVPINTTHSLSQLRWLVGLVCWRVGVGRGLVHGGVGVNDQLCVTSPAGNARATVKDLRQKYRHYHPSAAASNNADYSYYTHSS